MICKKIIQQNIFKFPKSTSLIEFCISLFPDNNLTILDFFAGSGTTGHALLKANSKDEGKRKFIICTNNENNIKEHFISHLSKYVNYVFDIKNKSNEITNYFVSKLPFLIIPSFISIYATTAIILNLKCD